MRVSWSWPSPGQSEAWDTNRVSENVPHYPVGGKSSTGGEISLVFRLWIFIFELCSYVVSLAYVMWF